MKSGLVCLSLALLLSLAASEDQKIRFDNYKVYRVTPLQESHFQLLKQLESLGVKFWDGPAPIGKSSDLMLAPHQQGDFLESIQSSGMKYEVYISNVQALIDDQEVGQPKAAGDLTWTAYYRLSDIHAFLDAQAAKSPYASVHTYGQSSEGRDLKLIKIEKPGGTKRIIFIESNIHAREWITNAVTTYIINELLNGNDAEIIGWLDTYDFYIVPVTNPDGYEYTHTTDRTWRKTRSPTSHATCKGADPNRNWDYQWNTGGSSNDPCQETFAGGKAFSEPSAKHLATYLETIGSRIDFYFAIHSYSQYFLIPYGYTSVHIPSYSEHKRIADAGATALAKRYGTRFVSGNIVDLLYAASGGSVDWVLGKYNTKLVLAAELRDTGRYGFILPAAQIIPSALELLDAIRVFIASL